MRTIQSELIEKGFTKPTKDNRPFYRKKGHRKTIKKRFERSYGL